MLRVLALHPDHILNDQKDSGSRMLIALFMYSTQAPSPPLPSANEPKYEKRWLDAVSLPLLMARVSRYKAGTDKLR